MLLSGHVVFAAGGMVMVAMGVVLVHTVEAATMV